MFSSVAIAIHIYSDLSLAPCQTVITINPRHMQNSDAWMSSVVLQSDVLYQLTSLLLNHQLHHRSREYHSLTLSLPLSLSLSQLLQVGGVANGVLITNPDKPVWPCMRKLGIYPQTLSWNESEHPKYFRCQGDLQADLMEFLNRKQNSSGVTY